jgi:hypothetical protein
MQTWWRRSVSNERVVCCERLERDSFKRMFHLPLFSAGAAPMKVLETWWKCRQRGGIWRIKMTDLGTQDIDETITKIQTWTWHLLTYSYCCSSHIGRFGRRLLAREKQFAGAMVRVLSSSNWLILVTNLAWKFNRQTRQSVAPCNGMGTAINRSIRLEYNTQWNGNRGVESTHPQLNTHSTI